MSTDRPIQVAARQTVRRRAARFMPSHYVGPLRLVGLLLLPLIAALIATVLCLEVLPKAENVLS